MKCAFAVSLVLLIALCGCGRRNGLYADRSVPLIAPTASAEDAPRFVGLWAPSAAQCVHPLVLKAHSLSSSTADCDFGKVQTSPAGYAFDAVCHTASGPTPTRLIITAPNKTQISLLTISGGPFRDAAALQRCEGP
ncbi:MAG TPA: hypothetical protein VGM25_12835 [Caulobacteraceae bacterium]|jgi:hypothetical protein